MRLQDKVSIITGAARGIGKGTAVRFAKEGAKVVVCDFDEAAGVQTVADITAAGGDAIFVKVDVTNRDQINAVVAATMEKYGRIDVLINNAGITADATLGKMTEEQWDRVININLKGVFQFTQAVIPHMVQQGSGRVITASSVVGIYGNFGQTNYAATKWGVIGMTKTWAKELGGKGLRFNAVAPGFIATEMVEKMPEKVVTMMKEKAPVKRLGTIEDVAACYLFLASDEADFINGEVLSVDGGVTL
jgi:3-oxoacyl-[acyl-carrier protein] reductase